MNTLDQLNKWLKMPPDTWFVFGAKSMELELERAGATVPRTTLDVDIAIVIDDWSSYERLMNQLVVQSGFDRDPGITHRLIRKESNHILDIIPFGELAPLGTVDWPKNESRSMDVRGFGEIISKGCWLHKTETGSIQIARFESLEQFVSASSSASATAAARILTERGVPDVDLAIECLQAMKEGMKD